MPINTTISLPAGQWTAVSEASATEITFQNNSLNPIILVGSVNEPLTEDGLTYLANEGEIAVELTKMFPGADSGARLWALSRTSQAKIFVSHA